MLILFCIIKPVTLFTMVSKKEIVRFNFMCQLDWTIECPDFGKNYSGCVHEDIPGLTFEWEDWVKKIASINVSEWVLPILWRPQ